MSPSLSVARAAEVLVFTAFEDNGHNIYRLAESSTLAGTPADPAEVDLAQKAEGLPPSPRPDEPAYNRVSAYLADANTGLPPAADATAYPVEPYRAKLGLDYLSQPQIGVAVGGGMFGGAGLYGGISGIFSDLLGGHTVGAAIQAEGAWDEVGGQLQYLNSEGRWSYGLGLQRIPIIYGYYAEGVDGSEYVQQIVKERVFDSGLAGYASYPISRVQRLDFGAGVRRISLDRRIQELRYDLFTGNVISDDETSVDGPSYNLVEAQTAWVFDSALFGYTGPVAGSRARVSVSPTGGQLQFLSTTADFRKYFYLRPFTLALRGMHFGRYGRNAEDTFSDIYLGNPALLRGYNSAAESCAGTGQSCSVYNQLIGSRFAVANVELRVPLIRPGGGSGAGMAFPPVDAHAFYDAGVAWTSGTTPTLQRGVLADATKRGVLTSAGVGIRTNVFGFLVLEVDYVRAFEVDDDWRWVFAVQPGF
jgi:hypothetical protein